MLKSGDKASTDLWCYQADSLRSLRVGIEECQSIKIERDHLKKLNEELINMQTEHKPIWKNWWFKLPLAVLVGGVSASLVGKETNSAVTAGVVGGALGGMSVMVFEF